MVTRGAKFLAMSVCLALAVPVILVLGPSKLSDYAYRELAYRVIVERVTAGLTDEEQITYALAEWIGSHEFAPPAAQVPAVDLTVFNDLVRGIGWCDQIAWGLSTLLAQRGIPSTLLMLSGAQQESRHTVAAVYLKGEWRVVDPLYKLTFVRPTGQLGTFEDLANPTSRLTLVSAKRDAIKRVDAEFFPQTYYRYFEPAYPATMWAPLTETKDVSRRFVSTVVAAYERVFGDRFVHAFQDAWLRRQSYQSVDEEIFLRARHYDLFFRTEAAAEGYRKFIAMQSAGAPPLDAWYFLGRLQHRTGQWASAIDTFTALLAYDAPLLAADKGGVMWTPFARYFRGTAFEALGALDQAQRDYELSAREYQVDSVIRLSALASRGGRPPS
jgi:tetratricopeptide (TPR) repeat protein